MAEGQLSLTINRIYEELSNDESQMLIYLCSDLDGGCSKQDVKEILKSQIKSGVVDHLVLAELLYRIKRFDLLKKILCSNKKQVEALLGSRRCTVSAYRVLMAEISEDLDKEDLHSLIFLLNDSIPKGRLDKATSFLDVVIELEKLDKVSPNKVDLIEQCLRHIHRKDLEKKVLKYRRSSQALRPNIATHNQREKCLRLSHSQEAASAPPLPARIYQSPVGAQAAENIKVSFPVPETGMQNPGEVYRMQRRPFGVCLIIDCVGSDGDMLKHTFKRLHFQVILYKWLSLSDAYSLLKETARMREHRNSDCFVCCIISRGSSTKMIATEKEGPGISFDTIKQLFTVEHCPDLSGKPKLFFIQNYTIPECCDYNDVEVDGPFIGSRVEYIPNEADVFWSCCKTDACILEKVHHRSEYLHALSASLLRGQKSNRHLIDIHTEVNSLIYEKNGQQHRETYTMDLRHTLRKKLLFPLN
ncbi:CASP8 and FADD-like apoptosis regulator isoform X1 [Acipenser oxyrinchus oxyrinchus]|uniref:CASP8 and FADD-like apoptosis regulator isoform X1 n=1 Tax=Acipenser oxyrinchus oxyrinchus TaxID=40147 RepID=A0AAD8DCT4_ACIOX|nr:CASP8 and FADD-like apoptosis regulator isoform X1 [Acipenser oxyrinchus oxyrinchus]